MALVNQASIQAVISTDTTENTVLYTLPQQVSVMHPSTMSGAQVVAVILGGLLTISNMAMAMATAVDHVNFGGFLQTATFSVASRLGYF